MSEIISAASKPPEEGRIPIWLVEVYKGQGLSVKMAHRQHTHIAFADGGVGVEMEITSEGARVINTFLTVSEEALIAFVRGSGLFTSILPAWFYHSHPDYLMRSAVTLIMHEEVLEQPELELDAPYLRSYRSRDEDDGMGYSFGNGVGLYDEEHGLEYWAPSITCYGYHGMFDTDTAAVFVHRSSMAGETYYQIKIGDIDPTVKEMMLSGRNVDLVQAALTLGRPRLSSNPPARF